MAKTYRHRIHLPAPKPFKFSDVYARAKKNALVREIPFTLTPQEFNRLVERAGGKCEVSGVAFSRHLEAFGKRKPFAPSLDRIDSCKGYTRNNCRLVCIITNLAMNEWGEGPLLTVCKAIYMKHLRERIDNRKSAVCRDSDWVTVAEFLKQSNATHINRISFNAIARKYCENRNIEPKVVQIKSYQRVDLTWAYNHVNAFPAEVLPEVLRLAEIRHQSKLAATELQPSYF